jgi:hypothetical protein
MRDQQRKLTTQNVGNVGLYYVCYQLSRRGWNVMPTARNARGVDVVIYNQDATRTHTLQVKTLSKRYGVPLEIKVQRPLRNCCEVRRSIHRLERSVTFAAEAFVIRCPIGHEILQEPTEGDMYDDEAFRKRIRNFGSRLAALRVVDRLRGRAEGADERMGKELFSLYCVACHGFSGKGEGPVASVKSRPPVFRPRAMALLSLWLAYRLWGRTVVTTIAGFAY